LLDGDGVYCMAPFDKVFQTIEGTLDMVVEKNKNSHEVA
jgi:hypothetical protein